MAVIVRPKKKDKFEEGTPRWMVTYGDLVTQMLVFFVMLFSFSTIDPVKLSGAAKHIREQFGGSPKSTPPGTLERDAIQTLVNSLDTDQFNDLVARGVMTTPIEKGPTVELMKDERGIKFMLGGDVAFAEGSAELIENEATQVILNAAVNQTKGSRNVIELRGYTSQNDEDAVTGPDGLPDHWMLGFGRAKVVADRLLVAGLDYRRVRITSGGMTEPREKGEKLEVRHRNRRVEIVVTDKLLVD
jgi:chemotaxis protein MotB